MLVNTRLIILVSVLQLLLFTPHCPRLGVCKQAFGGHWTYQDVCARLHTHSRYCMIGSCSPRWDPAVSTCLPPRRSWAAVGLHRHEWAKILAFERALQWVQLADKHSWYC
jgi:hypothetical protein